jgi:hypothetical protein
VFLENGDTGFEGGARFGMTAPPQPGVVRARAVHAAPGLSLVVAAYDAVQGILTLRTVCQRHLAGAEQFRAPPTSAAVDAV